MHSSGYFQVKENKDISPYGILIPLIQRLKHRYTLTPTG